MKSKIQNRLQLCLHLQLTTLPFVLYDVIHIPPGATCTYKIWIYKYTNTEMESQYFSSNNTEIPPAVSRQKVILSFSPRE